MMMLIVIVVMYMGNRMMYGMTKRSRPRHWYGWRERTLDQFLTTANSNKLRGTRRYYFSATSATHRGTVALINQLFSFFHLLRSFFLSFSFKLLFIIIIPLSWINRFVSRIISSIIISLSYSLFLLLLLSFKLPLSIK